MSAANYLEATLNVDHHGDCEASRQLDVFTERAQIHIEAVTFEQVRIARRAYLDYGKSHHPAGLNFGDVFAYALAKSTAEPLLYKGEDFVQTDITAAPMP